MGMAAAGNGGPFPIKRFLGRMKRDGILPATTMGAMETAEMAEVAGRLEQWKSTFAMYMYSVAYPLTSV